MQQDKSNKCDLQTGNIRLKEVYYKKTYCK